MAPPHKRRRLAGDSEPHPSHSYSDKAIAEPSPTLSHAVLSLQQGTTLAGIPRPVPQRIEEVHYQIQKRALPDHHEHHHQELQRRQVGTAISSALDSTQTVTVLEWPDPTGGIALSTINDDLGGTYGTTQTLTLASSPVPSQTSAPSSTDATPTESTDSSLVTPTDTPSEGFIGNSPSATGGTGVSSTLPSSAQPLSGTGSAADSGAVSGASNGTGTGSTSLPSSLSSPTSNGATAANISGSSASTNSTRTGTAESATRSSDSSRVSLDAGVFLATLSNGDVVTVTRSDDPFTTTFADGRVSTISPSSSRTGSSSGGGGSTTDSGESSRTTATRTSDDESSETQTSQQRSTETSVNFVTDPNQTMQAPASGTGSSVTSTSSAGGGGGGGGSNSTAPPATIAGGVVGGAAGIAILILIALVFLRWWKRRAQNGHHALPPSSEATPDPDVTSSMRGQPGMAERAGLRPLVGAVPAFFRHSNRSSEPPVPPSERGFTRVSGRKLPSQFSAGMTSAQSPPPPTMPLSHPGAMSPDPEHERNLSSHSFYRDSDGFYGGEGPNVTAYNPNAANNNMASFTGHSPSPSESLENPNAGRGPTPEEMTLSPGPQRTPTVHRGGPYTMSPSSTVPSTPAMPLSPAQQSSGVGSPRAEGFGGGGYAPIGGGGGYARSETPSSTVGDNRSSRFTEEV